jgi:hypothetical protein
MSIGSCECGAEEFSTSSAVAQFTLFTTAAAGLPLYVARVSSKVTTPSGPSRQLNAKLRAYQNGSLVEVSVVSMNSEDASGDMGVDVDTFWADPGSDVRFEVIEESGFAASYEVYLKVTPL